ncbi:helix-turn-helix domain-containing protein [Nonomuraea sp. 3N208]|uniref:helix-turn-helix domain-containing protein n=1 Tax=Nonomuraea sp. 3N208 TaxID=3457421 RepID=UPI003FCE5660
MNSMPINPRGALADFLTARRALVSAADCNLPASNCMRRVPGLRREEVAHLAGISADYYRRLEQGRVRTASPAVLHAIGRALRLNDDQQLHLLQLAQHDVIERGTDDDSCVTPQVQRLLRNLIDTPALVFNRYLDILAWNRLGSALLGDLSAIEPQHRNYARMTFLHPHTRAMAVDWESRAQEVVSSLRMAAGADPDQPRLRELVAELSARDPNFRTWWEQHLITMRPFGRCRLRHPVVGQFEVDWHALNSPDNTEQAIVLMSAPPGGTDHAAIRALDAWAKQQRLSAGGGAVRTTARPLRHAPRRVADDLRPDR